MTFLPEEPPCPLRAEITVMHDVGTRKCGFEGVAPDTAEYIRNLIRGGRTRGALFTKDGVISWERAPDAKDAPDEGADIRIKCESCGHSPLLASTVPDPKGGEPYSALVCTECGKVNWRIPNPPKEAPK